MGALHEGHISLINASNRECASTVSSVFVNPAQFAPGEDFDEYPRQLERDVELLREAGASAVFAPPASEMYPTHPPARTYVDPAEADEGAEGRRRPGFFRGVATVVTKLFNAVQPDRAYFGQKDGYQCVVVKQLCRDLLLPVDVRVQPTVREADGLAMSSRNAYLNEDQRRAAPALYKGLQRVKRELEQELGEASTEHRSTCSVAKGSERGDALLESFRHEIESVGEFGEIEYLDWACALTGRPITRLGDSLGSGGAVLLSAAVRMGSTRLIDNIVVFGRPEDLGEV